MSKKTARREQPPTSQEAAKPRTRWSSWKWLLLLAVGAGVGFGATVLFFGDGRPWGKAPEGMVWVPRGKFRMGSEDPHRFFGDAKPVHEVEIDGFWMDETEVTNAQFAKFVEETGYVTIAEQTPIKERILANLPLGAPEPRPEELVAGSLVFTPTSGPVPWTQEGHWWRWIPGASWRHPEGPGSDIRERMDHPVVQVCWRDAAAFAKWAGRRLPTEAEWERAARGGMDGKQFCWGDEPANDNGKWRCNIWQGEFPYQNTLEDGFARTAPVKSYAPNRYGLHDTAGNVWEWCSDWYTPDYYSHSPTKNPQGPEGSFDPSRPDEKFVPKKVQRGGSFLCSDGFCARYKPYGRGKGDIDTGTSHIGFRCAKDAK